MRVAARPTRASAVNDVPFRMTNLEIDHFLYAGPDLGQLELDVAERSGITAAAGGRHPDWGTHNALIGLEDTSYLELIAPEPGAEGPWGSLFSKLAGPSLQAWCARAGSADHVAKRLERAGIAAKRVEGGRELPDGRRLTWELVLPFGHGFGGALPFFIDWRDSSHPSSNLAAAARLTRFTVAHPDADALRQVLALAGVLPALIQVVKAERISLAAAMVSDDGQFVLEGDLDPHAYLGET